MDVPNFLNVEALGKYRNYIFASLTQVYITMTFAQKKQNDLFSQNGKTSHILAYLSF